MSKEDITDNRQNTTNINWYPGHMAKMKKQIIQDLKLIDVVVELLDARIPISSRNPDIVKLTENKKRIILLNKCDLADEKTNQKWIEKFSKEVPVILTDSNSGKGVDRVIKKVEELVKEEVCKQATKGRINKTIRLMILGIPNVGKSSFINRISKKKTMEVGNRPGVTKRKQWIRIGTNQELLDTPGVLWPKFDNEKVALNLAFTGTIKDDLLQKTEIAYELLKTLYSKYRSNIQERYKISNDEIRDIENEENNIYELIKLIAKKRGALISGGNIDEEKASRMIIEDFRNCKLGRISLEEP